MRIGVFLVLFQNLPFEAALDKAVAAGVTAVEIGSGGYPGSHHCPVDELLASAEKRKQYLQAIHSRGLILSALSCHYEPLHPDKQLAQESDGIFKKSMRTRFRRLIPPEQVMPLPGGSCMPTVRAKTSLSAGDLRTTSPQKL